MDIFIMDADGKNVRQVTKTDSVAEFGSAWWPHGAKLLTSVGDVADTVGKSVEIAILDVDDGEAHTLTSNGVADYDPAWSPDGTKIVFVSGDFENSDLMVMDADGTNARKIKSVPALHSSPAWSPDGKRIAYSRGNLDVSMLWVMDADGSGQRELTTGGDAAWSPNGEWIIFRDQGELHVITPDGLQRTKITTNGIKEMFPSWAAER